MDDDDYGRVTPGSALAVRASDRASTIAEQVVLREFESVADCPARRPFYLPSGQWKRDMSGQSWYRPARPPGDSSSRFLVGTRPQGGRCPKEHVDGLGPVALDAVRAVAGA